MQAWFSGPSSGGDTGGDGEPPSLLADWNSYASARTQETSNSLSSQLSLDLEAAVPESIAPLLKSANNTLLGAFSSVSKGVRELPGNVQTAASSMPSRKAIMYFGLTLATGVFFVFIAFTMFLPVMVVMPQKFAICFTLGCLFVMGSFFVLKGPRTQFWHMISRERLPFTAGFMTSMAATIYASMVLHSYLLSVVFSGVQVFALLYYVVSYFPGGSAGMRFLSSMLTSSVMKCFGR
ncbi:hypothetical protein GOP47_0018598 [Adiantum capillus-veneris]|uniref:Vesicle transport protein n=1 Tax=Adiantum capillus-veneris TaxID=13818 RepID=A0A9D4UDI3_ADICA|nr:hypothetical protein GOP47_0018598 [Adiantum capillus-veneris]